MPADSLRVRNPEGAHDRRDEALWVQSREVVERVLGTSLVNAFDRLPDPLAALEAEEVSYVLCAGQAINLCGILRITVVMVNGRLQAAASLWLLEAARLFGAFGVSAELAWLFVALPGRGSSSA